MQHKLSLLLPIFLLSFCILFNWGKKTGFIQTWCMSAHYYDNTMMTSALKIDVNRIFAWCQPSCICVDSVFVSIQFLYKRRNPLWELVYINAHDTEDRWMDGFWFITHPYLLCYSKPFIEGELFVVLFVNMVLAFSTLSFSLSCVSSMTSKAYSHHSLALLLSHLLTLSHFSHLLTGFLSHSPTK